MSLFPVFAPPALPIADHPGVFYPVRRIYCVGRNYADHAREMGADVREKPFFFCKPADAIVPAHGQKLTLGFPSATRDLHYEAELVVAIGKPGADIALESAGRHIAGYAVGLDMTRRDLQTQLKATGKPWEVAKSFDESAPIGALRLADEVYRSGMLQLWQNGELKQSACVSKMIWAVDEVIAELSSYFSLGVGDLIFTGTPAGVGAVQPGDQVRVELERIGGLELVYKAR
ncbi:MAG: fumarylacetoacetate hydrolase family protein [Burkholderiaceae bacterium]